MANKKKLAIITTHPVQYYAPLFRVLALHEGLCIKVFYTFEKDSTQFDAGFGKSFSWDIPLLAGYDYTFVSNNNNTGKGFWDVKNPTLIKEIKNWGAEALMVIGWNYKSHLHAMRYFKNRIPVLFRGDSTLLDEKQGIKSMLRKIVLTVVYKNIDYALYVGKANKKYYLKYGVKQQQLVFAPHAVENNRFKNINAHQQEFIDSTRKSFGINENNLAILFCGKFQSKKNPLLLIRAFKAIQKEGLHLILVGDGELQQEIEQEISTNKNIHLLPFQNQSVMPAVYRLGQIFCLPSQGPGETWGLVVNEAMACARAVLVSDKAGCATDLVKEGVNGFSFISNNEKDLQAKLITMTASKNNVAAMGNASAEIITAWNFEAIATAVGKTLSAYGR